MPYRWTEAPEEKILTLWPHQSMTPEGFVWFIGATALMLTMPLLAVLGSTVAWVLLAFFLAAIWGVWRAIMVNRHHRSLHEVLILGRETVRLSHVPPEGPHLDWQANPYWVTVQLRRDGPVENYLTLSGAGREVELGVFLTPEERLALFDELNRLIRPA